MTEYDDIIQELENKLEKEESVRSTVLLKEAIKLLKELNSRESDK